ncbi:MAG TPA: hypothetical protein VIO64_08995 [Pseudobacteroides sp.]|uniref:hypothetical protein n=1 Tax=Pseudobacteroides sp. TaxID=1968840 RepID=UPI002F927D8C
MTHNKRLISFIVLVVFVLQLLLTTGISYSSANSGDESQQIESKAEKKIESELASSEESSENNGIVNNKVPDQVEEKSTADNKGESGKSLKELTKKNIIIVYKDTAKSDDVKTIRPC